MSYSGQRVFHYTDSKCTSLFIIFISLYIKQFRIVDRFMNNSCTWSKHFLYMIIIIIYNYCCCCLLFLFYASWEWGYRARRVVFFRVRRPATTSFETTFVRSASWRFLFQQRYFLYENLYYLILFIHFSKSGGTLTPPPQPLPLHGPWGIFTPWTCGICSFFSVPLYGHCSLWTSNSFRSR